MMITSVFYGVADRSHYTQTFPAMMILENWFIAPTQHCLITELRKLTSGLICSGLPHRLMRQPQDLVNSQVFEVHLQNPASWIYSTGISLYTLETSIPCRRRKALNPK